MKKVIIYYVLVMVFFTGLLKAQEEDYANKWTLVAGLGQPVFGQGVNIAGTYFTKRLSFEYSHGQFLNYSGSFLTDPDIHSVYVLYTTGTGIGYRITRFLDVRAEFKLHQFEAKLNATQKTTYTNFDIGVGVYYRFYPFAKKDSWAKDIVIEPSVRYWQWVSSTMTDNKTAYINDKGENKTHTPYNFGLFFNVSIGYTFGLKNP
jgi:hypothetical protein